MITRLRQSLKRIRTLLLKEIQHYQPSLRCDVLSKTSHLNTS
jgi:hypothetical protein